MDSGDISAETTGNEWYNRAGKYLQSEADKVQQISADAYTRGSQNLNNTQKLLYDAGIAIEYEKHYWVKPNEFVFLPGNLPFNGFLSAVTVVLRIQFCSAGVNAVFRKVPFNHLRKEQVSHVTLE